MASTVKAKAVNPKSRPIDRSKTASKPSPAKVEAKKDVNSSGSGGGDREEKKGPFTCVIMQLQSNGATIAMHMTFNTKVEMETFLADREATRKAKYDASIQPADGKSDLVDVPDLENPGVNQLIKSLAILEPAWCTLKESDLKFIKFTGSKPSLISDKGVKDTKQAIIAAIKEDGGILIPAVIDAIVPSTWLQNKMATFHFKSKFLADRAYFHGQQAFMSGGDVNRMWHMVIAEYNGHMKTLKEVLMYARDKATGRALSIKQLKELYKDTEYAYDSDGEED